ncbi:MAG: Uma2 family endonuclease [Symploca sp. SIO2E6]|nr:Uma2 family endonuclease [Symploca sp. SIO2E6]
MVQTPTIPETETLSIDLPKTLALYVTQEQFAALALANRDLRLERTAQGELIVNPPTGWETGKRNLSISGELYLWWRNAGEPGEAFDSSTGFILPNGATRSPDASWVAQERWESLTPEQRGTFANICPDFVVELRSSSDSLKSLQDKMKEYIANGARLGWLFDPQHRKVEIYRSGLAVEVLENPAELSGENVLPGFVLNLRRVWGVS